jgi:hypothetical protein
VSDYLVVNNTENNGIQHIDCWMKVVDEETLLVKRAPAWHEESARIEQNVQLLEGVTNVYGRPYRIIRIDCPPYHDYDIAAYTNSLILNRKVLVPLFDVPGDAAALEVFREALPGYEVIGFPWGSWYYYDALHCRTRAVFDREMLRITHRRLDESVPAGAGHEVVASIDDRSEAGLVASELRVYWRVVGDGGWSWLPLVGTGQVDEYAAVIPGQLPGSVVEYYIAAADYSGRAETLPRGAPEGCYRFGVVDPGLTIRVDDPPTVVAAWTLTELMVTVDLAGEALVPGSALLHYDGGEGGFVSTALESLGGGQYRARLPRLVCEDAAAFYVSAEGSVSGVKTDPPGAPGRVFTPRVGELSAVAVFTEDFESGLPGGWSASGLWHVTDGCDVVPVCEGSSWAYYGRDSGCDYSTGSRSRGELRSPRVDLPAVSDGGVVTLRYCASLQTEGTEGYDVAGVRVNGVPVDPPGEVLSWQVHVVDLTDWAGQGVEIEWLFDSIDGYDNGHHGWQVDAVVVEADSFGCDFVMPFVAGDTNCDGVMDAGDVSPMFVAFDRIGDHTAAYPDCHWRTADMDGDGEVDLGDMAEFQLAFGS